MLADFVNCKMCYFITNIPEAIKVEQNINRKERELHVEIPANELNR